MILKPMTALYPKQNYSLLQFFLLCYHIPKENLKYVTKETEMKVQSKIDSK